MVIPSFVSSAHQPLAFSHHSEAVFFTPIASSPTGLFSIAFESGVVMLDLTQLFALENFSERPSLKPSPHSPAASLILSIAFLPSAPFVKYSFTFPAHVVILSFAPSSFSLTQPLNSPNLSEIAFKPSDTLFLIESQLRATPETSEAAPAAIRATPSGIPTPVRQRITPRANIAAPAIMPISFSTLLILPTMESQLRATPATRDTAPAAIRAIPKGKATPVSAKIAPTAIRAAPTAIPISFRTALIFCVKAPQLREAVAIIPTAPAAIIAIPRGVATPVKARIAPIPIKAPLTIEVMVEIEPLRSPVRESQLRATADTRETAPAAIMPTPSGIFTPVSAKIAPNVSNAPPTIASSVPIALRIGSDMESQLRPTAVARPIAPAAISAIPRGTETPVKANNAPIASNAPLTIPVRIDRAFDKSPLRNFQLIVAAVARDTAPATIKPAPRGTFTPENTRNAPIANRNPPRTPVMRVSVFANLSDIPFQFSAIVAASPTAPTAIRPRPRGIFAPVTTRIVPIASKNPLITAVISLIAPLIISTISSTLVLTRSPRKSYVGRSIPKSPAPPPIPAPPEPEPEAESSLGEMMFNSSIPSVAFFSFFAAFAALPRPSEASPALSAKSPTAELPAARPE